MEIPTTSSSVISKPLGLLLTFQILLARITSVDLSDSMCIYFWREEIKKRWM